jgi:Endosomal/lysosomal potassium channel TMEM175
VVAQFWLAHHRVFRQVAGHHEGLAWWNFAFLLTITAMPFTSSLLGQYGTNPLAVDIFAVNVLLASLATQATLLFGQRRDVLTEPADPAEARARAVRVTVIVTALALSVALAWVNTSAAKYCWLLIPSRRGRRTAGPPAPPQAQARPAQLASSPPGRPRQQHPPVRPACALGAARPVLARAGCPRRIERCRYRPGPGVPR